jgi:hypothetical protein
MPAIMSGAYANALAGGQYLEIESSHSAMVTEPGKLMELPAPWLDQGEVGTLGKQSYAGGTVDGIRTPNTSISQPRCFPLLLHA